MRTVSPMAAISLAARCRRTAKDAVIAIRRCASAMGKPSCWSTAMPDAIVFLSSANSAAAGSPKLIYARPDSSSEECWPRCAALGDFDSQIHSLGRPTGPRRGAGIAPTRQGAIGLAVRFDAKIKVTTPTSGYEQSLRVRTCVDWDAAAPFPPTLEQRQVLKFYVTRASKSPTASNSAFLSATCASHGRRRHREVVQCDQGLWIYPAAGRRQRRIRPHLRGRAHWTEHAQ